MRQSPKVSLAVNSVRWRIKRAFDRAHARHVASVRQLGSVLASDATDDGFAGPEHLLALRDRYSVRTDGLPTDPNGAVRLLWFDQGENYGDLLSPWLLGKMTGRPVVFGEGRDPHLVMVGSIIGSASAGSIVWGAGSYGTERRGVFDRRARYHAVRGPLTRSRLLNVGIDCPRVYGDPALLTPLYFYPSVEKKHEIGLVIRHTEARWRQLETGPGVKIIDLKTNDVARTTKEILACKAIVSSSLHGLILADAYGIPNAWLESDSAIGGSRPFGGEFKFYDYFASVNKMRHASMLRIRDNRVTVTDLEAQLSFDDRSIDFDYAALLDACPFLARD